MQLTSALRISALSRKRLSGQELPLTNVRSAASLNGPRNYLPAMFNFDGEEEIAEPAVRAPAAVYRNRIFLSTGAADDLQVDL